MTVFVVLLVISCCCRECSKGAHNDTYKLRFDLFPATCGGEIFGSVSLAQGNTCVKLTELFSL